MTGAGGASAGGRGGNGTAGVGSGGSTGGASSGGASGSGGSTGFAASYLIGADVSFAESASQGSQDNLLSQLKAHGFNAIRLRTFVDPKAADGYDRTNGYCDIAHTVAFGKKVKSLGMFLYVDFHYSDNWADPGKQCVPVAWQKYTTISDLATAVYDYTKDSITKLIAGGARPDMVQIGNETTPGMLLHLCDSDGQPTGSSKVTGSTSNWSNLGALFKAGIKGVTDVDAGILTALHIDRGGDKPADTAGAALGYSKTYIDNAIKQGVSFDVFGESCYQQYQGDPNSPTNTKKGWTSTLGGLAAAYPTIKILAAEYGPMQREINDVVFGLANNQGLGTFNWEPEKGGDWNTGHLLFSWNNDTFTAQPDLALYDQMKTAYASRL
jgi:arabinogalactan endo-1,4-beta-galactosidase